MNFNLPVNFNDPRISILIGAVLGIPASMLATFIYEKIVSAVPVCKWFGNTKVNGFWVGVVNSRHSNNNGPAINFYRIREKRGNLSVYIEHYKKDLNYTIKLVGVGLYSSPQVAIAYQFDKKYMHQSGVLAARLRNIVGGHELLSTFCQYAEKEDEDGTCTLQCFAEEYVLKKIDLSWCRRFRALIGATYFNSFADIIACPIVNSLIRTNLDECEISSDQ